MGDLWPGFINSGLNRMETEASRHQMNTLLFKVPRDRGKAHLPERTAEKISALTPLKKKKDNSLHIPRNELRIYYIKLKQPEATHSSELLKAPRNSYNPRRLR